MSDDLSNRINEAVDIFGGTLHGDFLVEVREEIERLRAENARLREALRPLATLWLYPDDIGLKEASDIREDPDWDEDANDMQTDDQFILRKHIRAARDLVGGRDG